VLTDERRHDFKIKMECPDGRSINGTVTCSEPPPRNTNMAIPFMDAFGHLITAALLQHFFANIMLCAIVFVSQIRQDLRLLVVSQLRLSCASVAMLSIKIPTESRPPQVSRHVQVSLRNHGHPVCYGLFRYLYSW
jgi:hypothetical protein